MAAHKARFNAEKEFLAYVKDTAKANGFCKKDVAIMFSNGNISFSGEDMSFPHWTITIGQNSKTFDDASRYLRNFGDTSFWNTERHREFAETWIKELAQAKA